MHRPSDAPDLDDVDGLQDPDEPDEADDGSRTVSEPGESFELRDDDKVYLWRDEYGLLEETGASLEGYEKRVGNELRRRLKRGPGVDELEDEQFETIARSVLRSVDKEKSRYLTLSGGGNDRISIEPKDGVEIEIMRDGERLFGE